MLGKTMTTTYLMFSPSYASLPPYRDRECGTWYTSRYVCDAATGLIHHITYMTEDPNEKREKEEDAVIVAIVDKKKLVDFDRETSRSDELLSEALDDFMLRAAKDSKLLTPEEVTKVYASEPLFIDDPL